MVSARMNDRELINLKDGRTIGLARYGHPDGMPVFFFHGFPGSRLLVHPDQALAERHGVQVLALDRPGIGLSTRHPGRRVIDWADDVRQVADAIGLARFRILGWSAGGPHALACAHSMPDRVLAVALACPHSGWFFGPGATRQGGRQARALATLARWAPWLVTLAAADIRGRRLGHPASTLRRELPKMTEADREIVSQPEVWQLLVQTAAESVRAGAGGLRDDIMAAAQPWGFDPAQVLVPVKVWYGADDSDIPPAAIEELIAKLPTAEAHRLSGEGHFLIFRHWEEIIADLVSTPIPI